MNTPLTSLIAVVFLSLGLPSLVHSQQAAPAIRRVARQPEPILPPGGINPNAEPAKRLSANYRVLFSGKSGEKAIGELSLLTASPLVRISGPLDASAITTNFDVSGTIEEREGGLIAFEYSIRFEVPVSNGNNTQYYNHSCTGSLLMKQGKAYDILKTGGITHSVMITPEPDK